MDYFKFFAAFLTITALVTSCHLSSKIPSDNNPGNSVETERYTNPVFEPILADPTVIRADDQWFYAYGTQDDWGDGQGSRITPILRSRDLAHWEYRGNAFTKKPDWKPSGGLWAPCIVQSGNKYHLYYSYSVWADPNPGIGVAVASSPEGPFEDLGKMFLSSEAGMANVIDPYYVEEGGKKYLFCGSYNDSPNQGIHALELTEDGLKIKDFNTKVKITAGDFEAVMIHKRRDHYYLFASKGGCCDGENSTYRVVVGRSKDLLGPYMDKENRLLTSRGSGSVILQGNETYAGPGHNARLIADDEGTDWLLYHAIDKSQPRVPSGANRRVLMLDKIIWTSEGWPEIKEGSPSTTPQAAPVFR